MISLNRKLSSLFTVSAVVKIVSRKFAKSPYHSFLAIEKIVSEYR